SLCPTIDIELFFNENSSKPGGYDAYWVRDGFPSMGIYVRSDDNQSWHTLAEDPERIKSAWLNWLALKDGFLQNVNLPPGCNVQYPMMPLRPRNTHDCALAPGITARGYDDSRSHRSLRSESGYTLLSAG